MALHELSLFSGAGGGLLGSKLLGWKTICAVEQDPYCIEVLKQRQRDGLLEQCPIWDDVRTFDGRPWRGLLHHGVVSAGFPCQPFSLASDQQAGESEKNMWPDTARILGQCLPAHIVLENVPGLLGAGKGPGRQAYFGTILGDLSSLGYDCRWGCISARECGAPHIRDRLWIVGHANRDRQPTIPLDDEASRMPELVADTNLERLEERKGK